jgi:hypothetical protein
MPAGCITDEASVANVVCRIAPTPEGSEQIIFGSDYERRNRDLLQIILGNRSGNSAIVSQSVLPLANGFDVPENFENAKTFELGCIDLCPGKGERLESRPGRNAKCRLRKLRSDQVRQLLLGKRDGIRGRGIVRTCSGRFPIVLRCLVFVP